MQQPYVNRLNAVRTERLAVEDCLPMARALFGEVVERALQTLSKQFQIVSIAIDMYGSTKNDIAFEQKIRADLSSEAEENGINQINLVIVDQIKVIEDHLIPILRLDVK